MTIITAGSKYIDIDVLACSIAYKELLIKAGRKAEAVHTGVLNSTVTKTIKSWNPQFVHSIDEIKENIEGYVIVDISDNDHLEDFVDKDKVVEIYDHHFGFEDYWKSKLTDGYHIEPVGACATLIFEQYNKYKVIPDELSAKLLYTAIISNTLNFKASVAVQRDKNAAAELSAFGYLSESWNEDFFLELQENIFADIDFAVKNDANSVVVEKDVIYSGQLELWDGRKFLDLHIPVDHLKELIRPHDDHSSKWFLTIPCIKDGINIIISDDKDMQGLFETKLNAKFDDTIGYTDKLLMRKEIKKILLSD